MQKEKYLNRCDQVMAFSFYAMIYFLPISTALIEIFASVAQVTFFVKRGFLFHFNLKEVKEGGKAVSLWQRIVLFIKSFTPVTSYLSKPIGFFILINFFTIPLSMYPIISLKGFFFKLLQSCFSYFLLIECINKVGRLKKLLIAFFCSMILSSINGVAQATFGRGFVRGYALMPDSRVSSSFKHPNDFGAYLIIVVLVLFAFLFLYAVSRSKKDKFQNESKLSKKIFTWPLQVGIFVVFILSITCLCSLKNDLFLVTPKRG